MEYINKVLFAACACIYECVFPSVRIAYFMCVSVYAKENVHKTFSVDANKVRSTILLRAVSTYDIQKTTCNDPKQLEKRFFFSLSFIS